MSNNRNVRASETRSQVRAEEERPDTAWTPPSLLDAPTPRPGMVQRWIATSIQGRETPDNVYKRKIINHGQWAGSIGIEGMILCEMPEDKFNNMKEYYRGKSQSQNEAIPGELDAIARTGGIPIHQDRKSTSSRGRDISVMADD